jgi:hypothetical protein
LIVHWNGRSWSEQASAAGFFTRVAAAAGTAWAVGGTGWFTTQPLIERWNGKAWIQVHTPTLGLGGYLNGVAVVSASDAWAVGQTGGGPGDGNGTNNATLVLHWNGHNWTRVPSPAPAAATALNNVAATSATNAWAVGWAGTAGPNGDTNRTQRGLILHWNGHRWSRVPSPSGLPGVRTQLNAVMALSIRDAWAVGATHLNTNNLVFVEHWNGRIWVQAHSPTPHLGAQLLGISGTSANNIWAVGQTTVYGGCNPVNCSTAIVHWNGHRWSVVSSPNPYGHYLNALFGIVAISPNNAWAAGTTDYAKTLLLHWNGKNWS